MNDLRPGHVGTWRFRRRVSYDSDRSGSDGLIDKPIAVAGLAFHGDEKQFRDALSANRIPLPLTAEFPL